MTRRWFSHPFVGASALALRLGPQAYSRSRAAVNVKHARKSPSILQLSHCRKGKFWIINYAHWSQVIGQRITLLFPDDHCPAAAVQASRAGEPGS